jgi:sec-independent protein translocase protein TatC
MDKNFLINYSSHFREIRRRLMAVILVFLLGNVFGMVFYQKILRLILSFFLFQETSLILTSPSQMISLILSLGFFTGIVVAFPYFIYQSFSFIRPALKSQEYHLLTNLLLPSIFLLILGFAFGFYTMRFVVLLYSGVSFGFKIKKFWDLSQFLSQMIFMASATGLLFQLPIVLSGIIRLGLVSKKAFVKKRSRIYALLLISAALLPPTDPLSLFILTLPLLLLFETTLFLN